jgi:type II restriction enzyme
MRDFNDWLSKFKSSISDYSYNIDNIKLELNILNSLIG